MRGWSIPVCLLLVLVVPSGATVPPPLDDATAAADASAPAGLIPLFAHDGRPIGFTHGGDPIPADGTLLENDAPAVAAAGGAGSLECAGPDQYYAHLIYARAHDDDDQYASRSARILNLAASASAFVDQNAALHGASVRLRVLCDDDGNPIVSEAVLGTDKAAADYGTIFADLDGLGYNQLNVKHWVYYDDQGACDCGGIANIAGDDNPTPANLHNGHPDAGPMWAITFDYNSVLVMLHELGHNMGAVHDSAPHSTGAGHCWDGTDTMCYDDGGPTGHLMTNDRCSVERFDCGNDDYFHPNPPADNHLATHWNVGGIWNRFVSHSLRPDAIDAVLSQAVVRAEPETWMVAPLADVTATGPGLLGPSLAAGAAEAEYYTAALTAGQNWAVAVRYVGVPDGVNDFDLALLVPGALDDGIITANEVVAEGRAGAGDDESISIRAPGSGVYTLMVYGWSIAAPQAITVNGAAFAGEALVASIAAT